MATRASGRGMKLVKNCAVSVASVVLFLTLVEVAVRLSGYAPPLPGLMTADPELIWLPQRGDPRDLAFGDLPEDTLRVVSVGDSSVYGFGVTPSENFTAQLESRSDGRIATLNCAGPGFSSYQAAVVLETILPREKPDVVVVGTLWSDNNFYGFVDKEELARRAGTWYRFTAAANRLLSHLASWRAVLIATGMADPRKVGWGLQEKPTAATPRRVAINDYAGNLWRMVSMAEAQGGEVIFLLLPNPHDLSSPHPDPVWEPYRNVMREVARRRGYPLIEGPELFKRSRLPAAELFVDVMHPSKVGHALIAEAIGDLIREADLIGGGSLKRPVEPTTLPVFVDPIQDL